MSILKFLFFLNSSGVTTLTVVWCCFLSDIKAMSDVSFVKFSTVSYRNISYKNEYRCFVNIDHVFCKKENCLKNLRKPRTVWKKRLSEINRELSEINRELSNKNQKLSVKPRTVTPQGHRRFLLLIRTVNLTLTNCIFSTGMWRKPASPSSI